MVKYKMEKWSAFLLIVNVVGKFHLILKYLLKTLFTSSWQYAFLGLLFRIVVFKVLAASH